MQKKVPVSLLWTTTNDYIDSFMAANLKILKTLCQIDVFRLRFTL